MQELKEMLLERDYRSGMIDSAVQRARAIPRKQALNFTSKNPSNKRPVFMASYDPRLPSLESITMKNWISMNRMYPYLLKVFS